MLVCFNDQNSAFPTSWIRRPVYICVTCSLGQMSQMPSFARIILIGSFMQCVSHFHSKRGNAHARIKFCCVFNSNIKISKTRYIISAIRLMIQNQINQEHGSGTIDKCKNLKKYSYKKGWACLLNQFCPPYHARAIIGRQHISDISTR